MAAKKPSVYDQIVARLEVLNVLNTQHLAQVETARKSLKDAEGQAFRTAGAWEELNKVKEMMDKEKAAT